MQINPSLYLRLVKIFSWSLFMLSMAFISCKNEVAIPAYIKMDTIWVGGKYFDNGSLRHNITDYWVYVNDKLAGVFPTHCEFPVTETGNCKITVMPGIKENGLGDRRVIYPFYNSYDTSITISPESKYQINALVSYRTGTKMEYHEDFENVIYRLKKTTLDNSDSLYSTSNPDDVYEGKYSGKCVLQQNQQMEYATTDSYILPGNGSEIYIEVTLKSEVNVEFGFYQDAGGTVERYPVLLAYKTHDWKKIYIRITEEVTKKIIDHAGILSHFKPYIMAANTEAGNKTIWVDNIKLLHF